MKVIKKLLVAMLMGIMMAGQIELFGMGNKKRPCMEAASAAAGAGDESEGEDCRPMQRSRRVEEAAVAGVAAHAAGKNFACEYPGCGKEFANQKRLSRHKKAVHAGVKYSCDVDGCGKKFTSKNYFTLHKKTVHEGVSYTCDTCGQKFIQKGSLTLHKRTVHAGLRYACDVCGKEFTQQGNFTRHKKAVHEGVRYACETCGKEFSDNSHLTQHKRSAHEGVRYACDIEGCGKEFSWPSDLAQHKKAVHEGVRYSCDTCGKEFYRKDRFSEHNREKRCKKRKGQLLADAACAEGAVAAVDVDYERALLQESGAAFGELDDFGVVELEEELGTVLVIESTASAEEMMSCIEDGIGIEELHIKNNPHVTDKELIEIASNCLLLKKLDVSGSTGITHEGIRNFLGRCAGLCTLVVSEHDALSAADITQLRLISPGLAIEVIR